MVTLNPSDNNYYYTTARKQEMFSKIAEFSPVKFVSKQEVAKSTYRMKFAFMDEKTVFNLQPG